MSDILVIEDDVIIRTSICEFLREHDYNVVEASDGEQALELLPRRRFDLVISDFVLPKLHGLTLVYQIHAQHPDLPVIVLSGYVSQNMGNVILQGDAEFLQKPVDLEVLLAAVRRLVGFTSR
jgi:DNA-binding NtrC family response regulator